MPATKNTFLIFPFRFGPGLTARAKSKLVRVQQILEDPKAEPGIADQTGFLHGLHQLARETRIFLEGLPADAIGDNTFIVAGVLARVRYGPDVTPMARTTLTRVANELGAALMAAPTNPEKIRLWDCLIEESARALDKLQGRSGGGHAAAAAAQGGIPGEERDTGGEGEQG